MHLKCFNLIKILIYIHLKSNLKYNINIKIMSLSNRRTYHERDKKETTTNVSWPMTITRL